MHTTRTHHDRTVLGLIVVGVVGTALQTGFGVALARSMTTAQFGEFSAARGMLGLTTIVATLGLGDLIISALPGALGRDQLDYARGLLRLAPRLSILAGLVIALVVSMAHGVIEHDSVVEFEHFLAVMLLLPIAAVQTVMASALTALGCAVPSTRISRVGIPLAGLVLLGAFLVLDDSEFGVIHAVLIFGGGLLIATVRTWWLLRRALDPIPLTEDPHELGVMPFVRSALPFLGTTVFLVWLDIGGLIVIGWIHADANAVGYFAAATQLSSFVLLLSLSTSPLFLPDIARAIDQGDRETAAALVKRRNRIVVPLTVGLVALLAFFGRPLLNLYGEDYEAGEWALVALVTAKGVMTVFALAVPQLQYMGQTRRAVGVLAVGAAGSVVAMIYLGEHYSATGVAVGQGGALVLSVLLVQLVLVGRRRAAADEIAAPVTGTEGRSDQ